MVKSKLRGNEIEFNGIEWVYSDTKESTITTHKTRPCGHCNKLAIIDGVEEYDNCIGKLIGLMNACCGHGNESEAFVQFLDGNIISGKDAVIIQNILKKY